jgi:hypothetical protein
MLFTFAYEAAGASGARLSLRPLSFEGQSSWIASGTRAAGLKARAYQAVWQSCRAPLEGLEMPDTRQKIPVPSAMTTAGCK